MKFNIYFQIHHPLRLREINDPDVLEPKKIKSSLFDHPLNKKRFEKFKKESYLPTLRLLRDSVVAMKESGVDFKFSLNVSGVFLEFCKKDHELMNLLKDLSRTKCVEFLGTTYYQSLASLMDEGEFKKQVKLHSKKIKKLFGQRPRTFVNTELIFSESIARQVKELGFESILTEGDGSVLEGRNPNYVYIDKSGIKVLLRNKRLSNDVGLRFSAKKWGEWPLTAEKYAHWVSSTLGDVVNVYFDIRNFGIHHKEDSGIFWFLGALPWKIFEDGSLQFSTPKKTVKDLHPFGELKLPENEILSWSGVSPVNDIQKRYLNELNDLGALVSETGNGTLANTWRLLQMGDHYRSPHGLHNFSNVLDLFKVFVSRHRKEDIKDTLLKKPIADENRLFSVDVIDDYVDDELDDLEFISDSLRDKSFD